MLETNAPIYVVDDDPSMREALESLLRSVGSRVESFASAQEFLAAPRADAPSCLVLDVQLPGLSGLDLQRELAKTDSPIPIVFLSGHASIPMSVQAMKAGAVEFLTKPFRGADLLSAVEQAISGYRPVKAAAAPEPTSPQPASDAIVGAKASLGRVLELVDSVAPTQATVLLRGETGTGKEVIARALHERSERSDRAFVKVNCAAIPTGLLESELFGHERGAYTGAHMQRIGRFERANGGTLFLDEIGDIPLELQPKLLRVLQEQEFERLGGTRTIRADVRLVAATNRDLEAMVAAGAFRSDLYYRLNVFPISLPSLRERRGDIPALVRHFTQRLAQRMQKHIDTIPADTMDALCAYDWPGNVRELENVIERAVILSSGPALRVPMADLVARPTSPPVAAQPVTLVETEREAIRRALDETRWMVGGAAGAAARLGMKRTTLQSRIRKLGIQRPNA